MIVWKQSLFFRTKTRFYDLTLKEGGNVIYKDKIFCTDQTISNYSVNNAEYTIPTGNDVFDNDYIIVWKINQI